MRVFVGIDGGATRATAWASDASGRALARVEGRIALIRTHSAAEVARSVAGLVRQALDAAGAAAGHGLCCALTGTGRRPEREAIEAELRQLGIARHVRVTTDAEAALFDSFGNGPGIVLIAGTGSIAWGRGPAGLQARVGGWGPVLGDGGSAWAIALAALRAVARAEDGMAEPTRLREAVLDGTGLTDTANMIQWIDQASRADVAALAPRVLDLASADTTAASIVAQAVSFLALHVVTLAARIGPWNDAVPLALGGGLLRRELPLRLAVQEHLAVQSPIRFRTLDRDIEGARGAAELARQLAG